MTIWRADFWKALAERAIKTFAGSVGSLLLADDALGLIDVRWLDILSVAGLSTLISVLFSVGSNAATGDGPSLGRAEVVQPAVAVPPADGGQVVGNRFAP